MMQYSADEYSIINTVNIYNSNFYIINYVLYELMLNLIWEWIHVKLDYSTLCQESWHLDEDSCRTVALRKIIKKILDMYIYIYWGKCEQNSSSFLLATVGLEFSSSSLSPILC
mgnify:CR=1 FL=1